MIKELTSVEKDSLQSLLTIDDLERMLKLHRRTIARLCESGKFPAPIKLGNSNRWRREDVESATKGSV